MTAEVAITFLGELWAGGLPPAHYLCLWRRDNRESEWYDDAAALARRAEELAPAADVYIGGATATGPPGPRQRVTQRVLKQDGSPGAPAAAIPGFWLDLDYEHKKHKKPGLPSAMEAERAIGACDPAPSIVVYSGHGYQLWWALTEPWIFADDGERAAAEGIMVALRNYLSSLLGGAVIDSTHDVSRVMRLPGTRNHGSHPPIAVTIAPTAGPARSLEWWQGWASQRETEPLLDTEPTPIRREPPVDRAANRRRRPMDRTGDAFPADKHEALITNHPNYAESWAHNRPDLPDRSISGYEMSLVRIAAGAGWTDEELAALMLRHRREHGGDEEKAFRRDYVDRTIRRARASVVAATAGNPDNAPAVEDTLPMEALMLDLGLGDFTVIKHPGDAPEYWLRTAAGEVSLGNIGGLTKPWRFQDAVASSLEIYIPDFTKKGWRPYVRALLAAVEVMDIGPEAHRAARAQQWIASYLDAQGGLDDSEGDARTNSIRAGRPRQEDGRAYITIADLGRWLREDGERRSRNEIAQHIAAAGWERDKLSYNRPDGLRTSRSYWRGPTEEAGEE